jgi:two-component system, sensor histidine kinase and response regulator
MKTILVVDDAEFILESASTLLRFEGYNVLTAADGEEGVEAAFTQKPDLILCDISMPKLDGYGVLDKIRANPATETIPFIFLTAFTEKSNMRAGMEKGADDFLIKPYTRDELISAIDAQWSKHSRIEKQVQEKVDEVGKSVTYTLPHEFRTVLNEVINSAKYMNAYSNEIAAEEIKEVSNDIVESSNRLLKITENFLTFARIEPFVSNPAKRKQLRNHKTDEPSAIFLDIASLKGVKYDRNNDIVHEKNVSEIQIQISTESFHKIVDELLDNAFRFSNAGTQVILSTWEENNMIFFSIKDHGRGMTKDQVNSIAALAQFERSVYEQQGIGMGLVICKKLVEIHDGSFHIDSIVNEGTNITFSLHKWID